MVDVVESVRFVLWVSPQPWGLVATTWGMLADEEKRSEWDDAYTFPQMH